MIQEGTQHGAKEQETKSITQAKDGTHLISHACNTRAGPRTDHGHSKHPEVRDVALEGVDGQGSCGTAKELGWLSSEGKTLRPPRSHRQPDATLRNTREQSVTSVGFLPPADF